MRSPRQLRYFASRCASRRTYWPTFCCHGPTGTASDSRYRKKATSPGRRPKRRTVGETVPQYKYNELLEQSEDGVYDELHEPGAMVHYPGIYRCEACGVETVCTRSLPLPAQNDHAHFAQAQKRWRLVAWALQVPASQSTQAQRTVSTASAPRVPKPLWQVVCRLSSATELVAGDYDSEEQAEKVVAWLLRPSENDDAPSVSAATSEALARGERVVITHVRLVAPFARVLRRAKSAHKAYQRTAKDRAALSPPTEAG